MFPPRYECKCNSQSWVIRPSTFYKTLILILYPKIVLIFAINLGKHQSPLAVVAIFHFYFCKVAAPSLHAQTKASRDNYMYRAILFQQQATLWGVCSLSQQTSLNGQQAVNQDVLPLLFMKVNFFMLGILQNFWLNTSV